VGAEFERIQRNVWRCVRIIEDLLEFSRDRKAALRPVALDPWIEQQVAEARAPEGLSVRCELDSGARLGIDSEKLHQAFGNVLLNAFQASEAEQSAGGEVVVRTRNLEGMVAISVSDRGAGMSPEVQRRMFEPLFSTKAFGVGLGMPLVKRIAEQHGGSVDVESVEGEGTTVTILLPLTFVDAAHGEDGAGDGAEDAAEDAAGAGGRDVRAAGVGGALAGRRVGIASE
jgi:signal transduction histidine kinase